MNLDQDENGRMTVTTGSGAGDVRAPRAFAVLLAIAVVAWGVGYRASLYSARSVTQQAIPPALLLAHRACLERGATPGSNSIAPVSLAKGPSPFPVAHPAFDSETAVGRLTASGPLPGRAIVSHRLWFSRPPPAPLA
jgi:hypothetical protein